MKLALGFKRIDAVWDRYFFDSLNEHFHWVSSGLSGFDGKSEICFFVVDGCAHGIIQYNDKEKGS